MFSALLNILWVVLGGLVMALGWWLAGLACAITIVGLPWARSCFVIGAFSLWPFGQEAISRRDLTGRHDLGTGALGLLGNVLWFLVAGDRPSHLSSGLLHHDHWHSLRHPAHQARVDCPGARWDDRGARAPLIATALMKFPQETLQPEAIA